MPSLNILARIHRKRGSSSAEGASRATPEPRPSQSLSIAHSSPFERRIHPDLNALAAELSSSDNRPENHDSRPSISDGSPNLISLTPWMRNKRNSTTSAAPTHAANIQETIFETVLEPVSADTSRVSSSIERPESRTNRILNRLTGLAARTSPSPNPPSAWSTFGRRKSRRHASIPHVADFGASPDVSLSNSQRSHASSNQMHPNTSAELSSSLSNHSFPSSSPSQSHGHSRSQSQQSHSFNTPSHSRHHPNLSPSSGFTFGSIGPTFGQSSTSPRSSYPAFRFSMFGDVEIEAANPNQHSSEDIKDRDPNFDFESLSQPRPFKSMPSLVPQDDDLIGFVRPRAQDIFPTSLSSEQLYQGSRKRRDTNRSPGSSYSIKRQTRKFAPEPTNSAVVSGESPGTRRDNIAMLETLGTPFHLQQASVHGPSTTPDPAANLLDNSNPSTDAAKDDTMLTDINASSQTPTREKSPSLGGSGDELTTSVPQSRDKGKGKGKGKGSETLASSPNALADFTAPSLPISPTSRPSRPTTPLRSAMASTSRFDPILLTIPTSPSSSSKGKRKVDEVDGTSEDATANSASSPRVFQKQHERATHRATFAAEPRTHRISTSSYSQRKRARISSGTSSATNRTVSEDGVIRVPSLTGSRHRISTAVSGHPSSRGSRTPTQSSLHRAGSTSSHQLRGNRYSVQPQRVRGPPSTRSSKRNSISATQTSIPISALVSPHAPSISIHRSTAYHMRDPRKPFPIHPTSWSLSLPSAGPEERGWFSGRWDAVAAAWDITEFRKVLFGKKKMLPEGNDLEKQGTEEDVRKLPVVDWVEGGGSPLHAWFFFLGFILFPVWWIAGIFVGIPKTRRLGGGGEKGVVLDDPQVEHDAKSWRTRCRVMAMVSILTYVPFIVLVAIFVPRP
ncbi:hypothetical protein D9757_008872 [Collybiopsis confluens]|uniref:Uncharacterized protein n=1 Tax=Collybiopsis confluens TaxID=2823264 RepID=A0A8H5M0X0_9AGAR|nr:hypothetical protein D9757_008872 [Collybiopsis confluens]